MVLCVAELLLTSRYSSSSRIALYVLAPGANAGMISEVCLKYSRFCSYSINASVQRTVISPYVSISEVFARYEMLGTTRTQQVDRERRYFYKIFYIRSLVSVLQRP